MEAASFVAGKPFIDPRKLVYLRLKIPEEQSLSLFLVGKKRRVWRRKLVRVRYGRCRCVNPSYLRTEVGSLVTVCSAH